MSYMQWHLYNPWPWTKIVFADGTAERGIDVYRRRLPDGKWEYRRLTALEKQDRLSEMAI